MGEDINVNQDLNNKLRKAIMNARAAQNELDINQESIDRSKSAVAAIDMEINKPLAEFHVNLAKSNEKLEKSINAIEKLTHSVEGQQKAFGDNRKQFLKNTLNERKQLKEAIRNKKAAAKESKVHIKSIEDFNKSVGKQLISLTKTKEAEQSRTKELYSQKSALKEIYKKNEQIQKQHREDLNLITKTDKVIQKNVHTDLARLGYERGKQWAYNPATGRVSRGKMAAVTAAAGGGDMLAEGFTSSIDVEKAGVNGGWSGHTKAIGERYGNMFGKGFNIAGGIASALKVPILGEALGIAGEALQKKISLFTDTFIQQTKFGLQDQSTRMAASRLDSRFNAKRADTPIMITGMDSSASRAMIENASEFGIGASAGEHSTFMQFAALNRAWGDVSGPLRELIGTYDDQAVAVKELDKAYGYGRKSAKELGMGITQAAFQFATAGKLARFAGVDASVAEGLMGRMSDAKTGANLRLMGYDPHNIGSYIGNLIAAPKSMGLAMQTYFASDGGRKNVNPLTAGFMAEYGDPAAFKYNSETGVASFGENKSSEFLLNMKKEQMRMISNFGGGADGFYQAQNAMRALGQTKEQFDLLSQTDIGAINSKFADKYEKVSDSPMNYLRNIYDISALEEGHMRKMVSIVSKETGFATTVQAIKDYLAENTMTDEEKEVAHAKKSLEIAQERKKITEDNMATAYAIRGPVMAELQQRQAEGRVEDAKKYLAKVTNQPYVPTKITPYSEKYNDAAYAMNAAGISNNYGSNTPKGFITTETGYNLPGQAVINQRGASLVEMTISLPYATLQGIVSNAQKGSITTKK